MKRYTNNHGVQIRKRLKETFGKFPKNDRNAQKPGDGFQGWNHLWERMTTEEREWAEKFERLEYQIERGYAREAVAIARKLNPSISKDAIQRIREDVESKKRCNPIKAEADKKYDTARGKSNGLRAPKSNMYDPSDWIMNGGMIPADDEFQSDGEPALIEKGITINPEDALIEALDAAASHGVSLEDFLNNPKYHTPERGPGRPKKVKE